MSTRKGRNGRRRPSGGEALLGMKLKTLDRLKDPEQREAWVDRWRALRFARGSQAMQRAAGRGLGRRTG